MVRRMLIVAAMLCPLAMAGQEVLVPAVSGGAAATARKAVPTAVRLPFFDDFSNYEGAPSPQRWEMGGATVGTGFGQRPPTVGMLSLDALDAAGRLYPQANTSLFSADTATSLPVRLDGLSASDSVVMSFYYQPGGGSGNLWERVGDTPDDQDSLFLDFYSPAARRWQTVWSRGGCSVDSLIALNNREWHYVSLAIADEAYLDSAFRFRFRNYCSIEDNGKAGFAANCDQWNIDYVLIDRGRVAGGDPEFRDVAFVEPAPTMLAHYRAMPAWQFRQSEMAQTVGLTITNLYSSAFASRYSYRVVSDAGATVYDYDGGFENVPPYLPLGHYQDAPVHARPSVGFSFPASRDEHTYTVYHVVREGSGGDAFQQNDTVRFEQCFADYYAYDDGSAENGYGLTSTADSVYLAYRFDLNERDTLTAVDLYFNHTYDDANSQVRFLITVWASSGGRPGAVLYRDITARTAATPGFNHFVLERRLAVEGSIFVGFSQIGNDYINLGFDRSFNTADRICYLTSVDWQQSILSGSLMLRPRFTRWGREGIAGVEPQIPAVRISPNPASREVQIECAEGSRLALFSSRGAELWNLQSAQPSLRLDVSTLPPGVYVLRAVTPKGASSTKLIISH
mgnify:CR=1 FL=1